MSQSSDVGAWSNRSGQCFRTRTLRYRVSEERTITPRYKCATLDPDNRSISIPNIWNAVGRGSNVRRDIKVFQSVALGVTQLRIVTKGHNDSR